MKLPRDLAGDDLANLLCTRLGYRRVNQEGSHILIETTTPSQHRLAIPAHHALRIGTLNSILRAVGHHRSLSKDEILKLL
jgi:predicted RNA binding protein YcfA (HicA-like mRNA interferase family)